MTTNVFKGLKVIGIIKKLIGKAIELNKNANEY
jgi:hypothetical protein